MSDRGKQSLLAGFEEFIMWGNVIGLAVAVGATSSSVVNCVVNGIMNPLVGPFGTKDLAGYSSCLKGLYVINEKGEATGGIHIL